MDHEALSVGQLFAGRYRIEKFLAKGGFGAVYIAEQVETELRVALKVLWPHVLHSNDAVEKFRLEARVAGRVGSEHIVKVIDAGFDSTSNMPFLVMELLRGAELDKVVEQQGPLPPARVVSYFRQIAAGLDRAHGYVTREGVPTPIVHRDLKPENLFLAERESGDPMIKILDFGIAKVLTESTQVSQEVKGTPLYMAFEQVAAGKITPQTDIWPLGLIAFFLLTGKPYWKAANHGEGTITMLFGEVLSLPIEPPSARARELGVHAALPAAFDAWFASCVEREPGKRFASAGACAEALAAALGLGSHASGVATVVSAGPPSGSVPARGLGNTTATPLVAETGSVVAPPRGGLKWLAVAAALLVVGGAAAAYKIGSAPATDTTASALPASPPIVSTTPPALAPTNLAAVEPAATGVSPSATSVAPAASSAAVAPRPSPGAARPAKPGAAPPAATPAKPAPVSASKPADVYGDR